MSRWFWNPPALVVSLLFVLPLVGCGDTSVGNGEVSVRVYGEEFIEQGIPAEAVDDGWAVSFEHFFVSVDEVVVGGVTTSVSEPVDLAVPTDGGGHPVATLMVPEGSYSDSAFRVARVEVVGLATKDGHTETFDWVFDEPTRYSGCETTTKVVEGRVATFQVTIHADHLLYDSLVSKSPQVLFGPMADADSDGDGVLTQGELEATDIGGYDPGSGGGVDDLWGWLMAASHTLGHADGEGHCDAEIESN